MTIRPGEGVLHLDVPGQGSYTLHAESDEPDVFFDPSDGQSVVFERDGEGAVAAMLLEGGNRLLRQEGSPPPPEPH